jgi:hypothetical protein
MFVQLSGKSRLPTLLEQALDAARRGLKVLPLVPRDKVPNGRLVRHAVLDATGDEATIRRWWAQKPNGNIGVTGTIILDIDSGVDAVHLV